MNGALFPQVRTWEKEAPPLSTAHFLHAISETSVVCQPYCEEDHSQMPVPDGAPRGRLCFRARIAGYRLPLAQLPLPENSKIVSTLSLSEATTEGEDARVNWKLS